MTLSPAQNPQASSRSTPSAPTITVSRSKSDQTTAPVIIEARNVSVFYGDNEAIKSVSLTIPRNHVVAFIGPSGCGKSTFLRSINRMNDMIPGCRVTGTILIEGQDIHSRDVELVTLRRRVGLVFQKPNPFPRSIYENITFAPRLQAPMKRSELDALVEDCLRKAALWDEVKDRLKQSALGLSGGQQQRLCIARALATRPSVLLMDEPAAALDPIATGKIEDLINELKRFVTVVIVTHNMQQAARVSDRTAFFYLGKLIEYDHPSTIFTSPSQKQTEDYVTGRFG
jgi:phosphate transport system ATP-binding protein